jgi:PhnB protein
VAQALAFYSDVFGAELVDSLTVPESDVLIHAQIRIANDQILLVKEPMALPTAGTGHVTLHHYLEGIEAAFDAAVEHGAVAISPVVQTWWGDLNAVIVDPFGVRWNLAKRVERVSADEKQARLAEIYAPTAPDAASAVAPEAEADAAPVAEAETA